MELVEEIISPENSEMCLSLYKVQKKNLAFSKKAMMCFSSWVRIGPPFSESEWKSINNTMRSVFPVSLLSSNVEKHWLIEGACTTSDLK